METCEIGSEQRGLVAACIAGAARRAESETKERQRLVAEQARANGTAAERRTALGKERDGLKSESERPAASALRTKSDTAELRDQCETSAREAGVTSLNLIAAAPTFEGDAQRGLERAHTDAEAAIETIRAALRDLENEERSQQVIRGGAAIAVCSLGPG